MTYPGQSRERTAIAWGRTALGAAGLAVLLVRLGIEHDSVLEVLGGCVTVLAAAGFAWRGRRSYEHAGNSLAALRVLTFAITVAGVLASLGVALSS